MRIIPYKLGSKSAKELAKAMGVTRVNREGSKFRNNYNHIILNWGCSSFDNSFPVDNWINPPSAVKIASNKLSSFLAMQAVIPDNIPEFTEDQHIAQEWANSGATVLLRGTLTGHSGQGISVYNKQEDLSGIPHDHMGSIPPAPLYVKYIKRFKEFRVHVINGGVVDIQEKRKREGLTKSEINFFIRSYNNGWVFCRDDIKYSHTLCDIAISAVHSMGLDFGAVDIIYNSKQDKYYVLEVNTACGLDGSTVDIYANGLRNLIQERGNG